jgi:hypothetical protein
MIKFALVCAAAHEFESWFSDGAAYDTQVKRGFVQCPTCGSIHVSKAIMAPRVVTRAATPPAVSGTPTTLPEAAAAPMALLDERQRELRAMIRAVRTKLMSEAEDVGPRFVTEARRIHDGEADERPIYGQASLADAQALLEEGIGVMPIPTLPDEHH